jgi:hypothetical protein
MTIPPCKINSKWQSSCRIEFTLQSLPCKIDVTWLFHVIYWHYPHKNGNTPHIFTMISPSTTAAINHHCQQLSLVGGANRCTSPWCTSPFPQSATYGSTVQFLSGETTELGRAGGAQSNQSFSTPSCLLSFPTMGEKPQENSVSSLFQSHSTHQPTGALLVQIYLLQKGQRHKTYLLQ